MSQTAIYARKSTESEDRQVQSLEDQLNSMREVAKKDGAKPKELIEAKSAKEPGTRPVFSDLILAIQKGQIDTVYTWSINRLARNPVDGGMLAYLLQQGKLKLIRTIDRSYYPEDNAVLMAVESAVATQYIKDLRINVLRGMLSKAERGWTPYKPPMGYRNNPETREIDPDPVMFPFIRKVWELYLTGQFTVPELQAHVRELGLRSTRANGSPLGISVSGLYSLLANSFYAGTFQMSGKTYQGKHRPMVSLFEYQKAQILLRPGQDRRNKLHEFQFTGLIRCGICHCAITAERKIKKYKETKRTVEYTYYHCTGKKGCRKVSVSEEFIRKRFLTIYNSFRMPESVKQWCLSALVEDIERSAGTEATEQTRIASELTTERKRLDRLKMMRLDREVSPSEYNDLKETILGRITGLETSLERSSRVDELVVDLVREKFDFATQADGALTIESPMLVRQLARSMMANCVLTLETLEIEIHVLLAKIAEFEPLKDDSEKPKPGDILPLESVWWNLIREIRNLATEEVLKQKE